MPEVVYAPILKARPGELAALSLIRPSTRQRLLPILEILPGPAGNLPAPSGNAGGAAALRSAIGKTARKLWPWAGRRLLLDAGLLGPEAELRDGHGAVGLAVCAAAGHGVAATPVLRLADGPRARHDAAAMHASLRNGVALRLSTTDLDQDAEDINEALTRLLCELAIGPPDADLVLDLGSVIGALALWRGAHLVTDAVRGLSAVNDWRQVIVAAGAFPSDLTAISPWAISEYPRYDAALYDHLRRRWLPRTPTFGDYAVTHPALVTGLSHRASPQLRYAVVGKWLFAGGAREHPHGTEWFPDVCQMIAQHPEFASAALSSTDARIANPRDNRQRSATAATWQAISTTHHLDYVVQRLITLGKP